MKNKQALTGIPIHFVLLNALPISMILFCNCLHADMQFDAPGSDDGRSPYFPGSHTLNFNPSPTYWLDMEPSEISIRLPANVPISVHFDEKGTPAEDLVAVVDGANHLLAGYSSFTHLAFNGINHQNGDQTIPASTTVRTVKVTHQFKTNHNGLGTFPFVPGRVKIISIKDNQAVIGVGNIRFVKQGSNLMISYVTWCWNNDFNDVRVTLTAQGANFPDAPPQPPLQSTPAKNGPGMIILFTSGINSPQAGFTVLPGIVQVINPTTHKQGQRTIPVGSNKAACAGDLLNACFDAGIKAEFSGLESVRIYGKGVGITVTQASFTRNEFN